MKSLNSVSAFLFAATLLVGATGCNKGPKNPTFIPRPTTVPIEDDKTAGRNLAGTNTGNNANPNGGTTRPPVNPGQTLVPNSGTTPIDNGLNNGNGINGANNGVNGNPVTSQPIDTTPKTPLTEEQKNTVGEHFQGQEDKNALLSETTYFDLDKATIRASERPKLEHVAAYMKADPKANLRVEGNCDERGTEEYNRSLGERRALSVREYLVNLGVAPERVTTLSFGEDKPIDMGHDETAWAKNRRAEFVVIHPAGGIQ